ncbi:MAG: 50S ribosomal protein L25/general stress protein Ctc [Holosporales bacterium]|jgi:large subunit ribosomal protein L25|nr:50S ribosomal protein L25/general stress protein Ctc [Holosporales bacterium]
MSEVSILVAERKMATGTGEARRLRCNGLVPCIIYGDNKEPRMMAIKKKEASLLCHRGDFYSKVVKISVENEEPVIVLPKDVQLHPVTGDPLHLDFQRVNRSSQIKLRVPVEFINADKSPALKLGGILNVVMPYVELFCSPISIPEKFEIDLSGATFGKSFVVSDISIPDGSHLAHNVHSDTVLANVVQPQRGGLEEQAAAEQA